MPRFLCWTPSADEAEWNAQAVEAADARLAAERYADRHVDDGETKFPVNVRVRDSSGVETAWEVTQEVTVTFLALPKERT